MKTLKQLRTQAGILQSEISRLIGTGVPQISNFENSVNFPMLEDALEIEKYFGEKIDWQEDLSPKQRYDRIQAVIEILQRYPLAMGMEYIARNLRREPNPWSKIQTLSEEISKNNVASLLPPEFNCD